MIEPIKKAIWGSVSEMKNVLFDYFKKSDEGSQDNQGQDNQGIPEVPQVPN